MKIKSVLKSLIYMLWHPFVRLVTPRRLSDGFVGNDFGFGRGTPIDRRYIHQFFSENAQLVSGSCLEFGELTYINKYGCNVSRKVVFNYSSTAHECDSEIRGDITIVEHLPEAKFDCIVCVNVLNFIFDINSSLIGLMRMLKKNGVIVLTVAGPAAHVSRYDMDRWGDFWRFTDKAIAQLVMEAGFSVESIQAYGNPASCVAQINGYSFEDVGMDSLLHNHPDYQLVIGLIARKL